MASSLAVARVNLLQPIMNLLPSVYRLLSQSIAESQADPEYQRALEQVIAAAHASEQAGAPMSLLPLLACQACHAAPQNAVPVAAAWRALQIAAKLLDDVEDGDVGRISGHVSDNARVTNMATGLIAAAFLALRRCPAEIWYDVNNWVSRTIVQMAGGQHADLSRHRTIDVQGSLDIMAAKTGRFFALGAYMGARCATSRAATLVQMERFGQAVGMVVQLADDLIGLRRPAGSSDLALGQRTLPVHYALLVASPMERTRLEDLLDHAPADPTAETQARQLLNVLGGEIYLFAELARYRHQALEQLSEETLDPATVKLLHVWLAQVQQLAP